MSGEKETFDGGFAIRLPSSGGDKDRDVRVLLDEPHVKLLWISLKDGAELPPHGVPMPITVHAVAGRGTFFIGEEPRALEAGGVLSLAPGVTHAARPDEGGELVLLVHQLKAARHAERPWTGEMG